VTPIDDPGLRSQLDRRSGAPDPSSARLADHIRNRVADEPQLRARPWDRWRRPEGLGRARPVQAIVVGVAGLLVLMVAGSLVLVGFGGRLPSESAIPPPVPSAPMTTFALSPWSLDLAGLMDAVATARDGNGIGRIVVADVAYDIDGSDLNCRGIGSPDCLIVVTGSSPPIHVLDTLNANICPATWRCPFRAMPIIPGTAPAALRLRRDGDVEYVGPIRTPTSGGLGYTSGDLATYLGRLSSNDLDAYRLYVVSGWMSQGMFELKCLQISSDPDHQFSCGRAAWLSDTDYQPNQVGANDYGLVAPRPAIRLPNESYLTWAPGPPWAGPPSLLEPRYGTFLVRPVIPVPTSCFACADATAEVVARLDPPLAQPTASLPTTSPSVAAASLDPEAAHAMASAEKFEHSRATGDWQGAWLLLGRATRAVFGSEEQFAQQEAAYNATGATTYEVSDPSHDPDLLSPSYLGTAASEIQLQTARYVAVTHPLVEGASAGLEGLVVGSGTDGQWHVWIVH
jgi:hypothetical protein